MVIGGNLICQMAVADAFERVTSAVSRLTARPCSLSSAGVSSTWTTRDAGIASGFGLWSPASVPPSLSSTSGIAECTRSLRSRHASRTEAHAAVRYDQGTCCWHWPQSRSPVRMVTAHRQQRLAHGRHDPARRRMWQRRSLSPSLPRLLLRDGHLP